MLNATSSRIAVAAVETITAFTDWINISHIIDQDGRLLRLLCAMLDDVNLRLNAVECLLAIVNRRVSECAVKDLLDITCSRVTAVKHFRFQISF